MKAKLEDDTKKVEHEGQEHLDFITQVHDEEMQTKRHEFEEKKFADDQRYHELEQAEIE